MDGFEGFERKNFTDRVLELFLQVTYYQLYKEPVIKSSISMLVKIIILLLSISVFCLITQISYAQTGEKTLTEPKFGLTMKYPSDWTFIPTEEKWQKNFSAGIFDYTVLTDRGYASLGKLCPTIESQRSEKLYACQDSPVELELSVKNFKSGTPLKEFYDNEIGMEDNVKDIVGSRKNINTSKIEISGLSAIQRIGTLSGTGGIGKTPSVSWQGISNT